MQASDRIIVNTIAQYARTIINTLLSLYSARLVLNILGAEDYGIYSLVAGVVSMLSFFTNSLVMSTQRFLSVARGRNEVNEIKSIFSNSVLLHISIGIVVLFILEALAPLLFNGFLNIPEERKDVAMIIYQLVILMVCVSFITAPYRALLVSRENIVYTSSIDVVDGVLKVILVSFLPLLTFDKLEAYGYFMLSISAFNFFAFAIYSHKKYEECIFPKLSLFNKMYFIDLSRFTGWITYMTACLALRTQGLAIVLNRALGTVINSAFGLGGQISGMVSFICASFNNAISPQLMAAEGAGDRERMWMFAKMGSKFPFLLLSMIGIPVMFEMRPILELWLVTAPDHTMLFACTFIIMQIVDQLTNGLYMAKNAIGKIGPFVLLTYTPKLLILPIGWLVLELGYSIKIVCYLLIMVEFVSMILRIPLLRNEKGFIPQSFIKDVFVVSLPPILITVLICFGIHQLPSTIIRTLATFIIAIPIFAIVTYLFSLNYVEKQKINQILSRTLRK